MSTIAEFFAGKTVLVTGATGFLGKALVEKVLRSLPHVGRLYLLVRAKERASRAVPADERLWTEILSSSVFDRLKHDQGDAFDRLVEDKITVVNGDLTDERLGVSDDDYRRLAAETQVILNSAAVVVFDERVDLSLNLNALGARRMMDFARDCPRLEAVVHISTCYVSGKAKGWVKEEVAPPPFDVEAEIARLQEECAAIRTRFADDPKTEKNELVALGLRRARELGWHDTYTFTKWLGEQLTARYRGDVPTVILRPSIIESTFAEPEPGWIDGFRMGDPLFVGYGKGYLQDFPAQPDVIADLIPCDFVVNAILASAPRCAAERGFKVYQVATGELNPVHFRTIYDVGRDYFQRNPMLERDGTPIPTPTWTWPDVETYRRRLHLRYGLPLRLAHAALRPVSFLRPAARLRRRLAVKQASLDLLHYYVDIYSPYSNIESRYHTAHTSALWDALDPADHKEFPFDVRGLDWRDYIANIHIPGLKRNVLNLQTEQMGLGSGVPVRTIPELVARSADRVPDAVALQAKQNGAWVRITYDELQRLAARTAARLHARGLRKGDRVLLYADNQPAWGVAYLGAVSLGAVVVPVDRQLQGPDVLAVAAGVGARSVLTSPEAHAALDDATRRDPAVSFLDITAAARPFTDGALSNGDDDLPPVAHHASLVGPDDLASIIFTTGVASSDPRAVMLTHRNFLSNVMGIVQMLPPRPDDNFLSVLPLHHALEFTCGFLVPLFAGATVTCCDTMRSRVILDVMRETRATALIGVPRVFQILHEALRRQVAARGRRALWTFDALHLLSRALRRLTGKSPGRRLFRSLHQQLGGRLRGLVSGGAALAPRLFDDFAALGFELCEGYGLTETAPVATVNPLGAARRGSAGVPLPGVEVRILNPDERGVGEVAIRGPNVMRGYLDNPQATARALRDGWLHTGDVGYLDRDRYLYLTGRIKDVIVTPAGKNVYPEEVEKLYARLPHVAQLCVVGVWDDEVLGETVHGVVVPDPEGRSAGAAFEDQVRQAVQERSRALPTYHRLQRVHVAAEDLPQSPTGVIDRSRVKQQLTARLRPARTPGVPLIADLVPPPPRNGAAHALPGQTLEEGMRGIVAALANVPPARVTSASDLEADLRLDSLSKVELLLALETAYRVPLPEALGPALHTFGDLVDAVRQRMEAAGLAVPTAPAPEAPAPLWSRVLSSRGAGGDGPWLQGGPFKSLARWTTRQAMRLYAWSWFGFEARGLEHLPPGGFIVAANHCSHLDTGAVVTGLGPRGRDLFVMGARDYFFNRPLKGWFFHTFLKVIPFDRTDKVIEGLRLARAVLASGRPVLIYPEGKRSLSGELQPFKPGIGLLALQAGVPIVPCLIEGSYAALPKGRRWPRRGRIRVTFAPPVAVDAFRAKTGERERVENYRRIADDVRRAILTLQKAPPTA